MKIFDPRAHRLSLVLATAFSLTLAVSCAVEETNYGPPDGLTNKKLPSPQFPVANEQQSGGTDGICDGGAPAQDPNCTVSFKTDIYEKFFVATGTWQCAGSDCHEEGAAGSSVNSPPIHATDPTKAYNSLVNYQIGGKRYIDPCSTDPNASSIICNLQGACGTTMPYPPVPIATSDQLPPLQTWLQCGAPNN